MQNGVLGQPVTKRSRGRPPKNGPDQERAILEEASRTLNLMGASGLALGELGERLGLSRNSLYHYCRDAADLAYQCFLKSCRETSSHISAARTAAGGSPEKLGVFLSLTLGQVGAGLAALNDVEWLPEPQRQEVRVLEAANVDALSVLILEGVEAGQFRACDPQLVARSLLGMVSWASTSGAWLRQDRNAAELARLAHATTDLALNGLAAPGQRADYVALDFAKLTQKATNPFNAHEAAAAKADHLLAVASRLFNRMGVDGVRLDDIAAQVGVTKGAIYQHFTDKADIVAKSYERAFALYERIMAFSLENGATGLSKAINVIYLNVEAQAGSIAPLSPQPGLPQVLEPLRAQLQSRALALRQQSTSTLRQGVADGSCRPHDCSVIAEVSAGLFLWLPRWLPPEVNDPKALAREIAELATWGLRTRTD